MLMSRMKRKASENASLFMCGKMEKFTLKSYRKVILCMWLYG